MVKKIYGCVVVNGKEYDCDEMHNLDHTGRYIYGIDWVFGGDLSFEECSIMVGDQEFIGRKALKEALLYAAN